MGAPGRKHEYLFKSGSPVLLLIFLLHMHTLPNRSQTLRPGDKTPEYGHVLCTCGIQTDSNWFNAMLSKSMLFRLIDTVKSSNFVTLLDENIFFHKTFLTSPHTFFRYWNLYRWGLGIGRGHFSLGQCIGLEISFFHWVTKLEDRYLISSPLTVT
jgi:hypothetical protein